MPDRDGPAPAGPAPIVARCDRCGRELITLGTRAQRNDWIDTWPPANRRPMPNESCGGTFQRVSDPPADKPARKSVATD